MIQQGQPDPTGTNQKVWLSADRDIAVMFPSYVARALRLTAASLASGSTPEDQKRSMTDALSALASKLAAFTNGSSGEGSAATVHELASRVGFIEPADAPHDVLAVRQLFAEQLTRVVASAYFYGVRMSLHAGERAVNKEDLERAVKDVAGVV